MYTEKDGTFVIMITLTVVYMLNQHQCTKAHSPLRHYPLVIYLEQLLSRGLGLGCLYNTHSSALQRPRKHLVPLATRILEQFGTITMTSHNRDCVSHNHIISAVVHPLIKMSIGSKHRMYLAVHTHQPQLNHIRGSLLYKA